MKKKAMSREDAAELYRDLRKTMKNMKGQSAAAKLTSGGSAAGQEKLIQQLTQSIRDGMRKDDEQGLTPPEELQDTTMASASPLYSPSSIGTASVTSGVNGTRLAILLVLFFAGSRMIMSGLEYAGVGVASVAEASMSSPMQLAKATSQQGYTREEVKVLRSLDARREELQERGEKLDAREEDIERMERAFAAKLTQLRELTAKLEDERGQNDRKRKGRMEQLANVYGSMNPQEASKLMEQLDITIAVELLEVMPEKRIGQILASMTPERALVITRMLSEKTR